MSIIRIEKSELEAKKQEKLDLIRSIDEYRLVLSVRNNTIANYSDKCIDLEIKIDELMASIARYQQANDLYRGNLDKIPNWVKKIYGI